MAGWGESIDWWAQIGLFMLQSLGTHRVPFLFSPMLHISKTLSLSTPAQIGLFMLQLPSTAQLKHLLSTPAQIGLFMLQSLGTHRVSFLFFPVLHS